MPIRGGGGERDLRTPPAGGKMARESGGLDLGGIRGGGGILTRNFF